MHATKNKSTYSLSFWQLGDVASTYIAGTVSLEIPGNH